MVTNATYTLTRVCSSDKGTFGVFHQNGKPICVTCEEPWENNSTGISCIPKGKYRVVKRVSEKHLKHWHVLDVPNRSLILIHIGNTIKDIEGCILVGKSFGAVNGLPGVIQSTGMMNELRRSLPDTFTLIINGV